MHREVYMRTDEVCMRRYAWGIVHWGGINDVRQYESGGMHVLYVCNKLCMYIIMFVVMTIWGLDFLKIDEQRNRLLAWCQKMEGSFINALSRPIQGMRIFAIGRWKPDCDVTRFGNNFVENHTHRSRTLSKQTMPKILSLDHSAWLA